MSLSWVLLRAALCHKDRVDQIKMSSLQVQGARHQQVQPDGPHTPRRSQDHRILDAEMARALETATQTIEGTGRSQAVWHFSIHTPLCSFKQFPKREPDDLGSLGFCSPVKNSLHTELPLTRGQGALRRNLLIFRTNKCFKKAL